MYSPGWSELVAGVLCMIPGVTAAVLVEEIPIRALVDPSIIAIGIIGAIWDVSVLPLGLSLLYFLYFAGAVAIFVSSMGLVRDQGPVN